MPELPEVETYVRSLRPLLLGKTTLSAEVFWPRIIAAPAAPLFAEMIRGRRFASIGRRGKYMLMGLDSGESLVVHLRMTGELRLLPSSSRPRPKSAAGPLLPPKPTHRPSISTHISASTWTAARSSGTGTRASLVGSGWWRTRRASWPSWDRSRSATNSGGLPGRSAKRAQSKHQVASSESERAGRRRQHLRRRSPLPGRDSPQPRRRRAARKGVDPPSSGPAGSAARGNRSPG